MQNAQKINNFKVGFNNRKDTYTKKLGFINTLKIDGTWKNKLSYDNWIDKQITEEEYDNIPTEGFVINNNVGYMSYGNGREPKVRILDPRGFEVEITFKNFFDIIAFGVDSGKQLIGEYVYCYIDDRLSLINVKDPNYKKLEDNKVKPYNKEDLIVGHCYYTTLTPYKTSYSTNYNDRYIYLGEHNIPNFDVNGFYVKNKMTKIFQHKNFRDDNEYFIVDNRITKSKIKSFEIVDEFLPCVNFELNVFSNDDLSFTNINDFKIRILSNYADYWRSEKTYTFSDLVIKNPTDNKMYIITLIKKDDFVLGQYYTDLISNNIEFLCRLIDKVNIHEIVKENEYYKKVLIKNKSISNILFTDSLITDNITIKKLKYDL